MASPAAPTNLRLLAGSACTACTSFQTRLSLPVRMESLVDLLSSQPGLFVGELAHRATGRVRFLGDLGRIVVPDQRVERGGHTDRALNVALRLLPVRLEPSQRLVDKDAGGVRQEPHAL